MKAVNIGGSWKEVEKCWINIGGSWKEIDKMWAMIGGVWKEVEGLGLSGLYVFYSYILNKNFVYERRKLNPLNLATIQTTEVDYATYLMDYGTIPGKLLALDDNRYLHELNPVTFAKISSTLLYNLMSGESLHQHIRLGGTSDYLYNSYYCQYYDGLEDTYWYTRIVRRNPTTYAIINQKIDSDYGMTLGIAGVGNRLYRYCLATPTVIQELKPDDFTILKSSSQGLNVDLGGLGGGSDGSLIGTRNIDFTKSQIISYNIGTLASIKSIEWSSNQQPYAKGVVNLK